MTWQASTAGTPTTVLKVNFKARLAKAAFPGKGIVKGRNEIEPVEAGFEGGTLRRLESCS